MGSESRCWVTMRAARRQCKIHCRLHVWSGRVWWGKQYESRSRCCMSVPTCLYTCLAQPPIQSTSSMHRYVWLGSRVVSVLDSGAEGPGFKSQSRRCRVTFLGKLFTPIVPLHQAAKVVSALLKVARVSVGLAESYGSLPPGL